MKSFMLCVIALSLLCLSSMSQAKSFGAKLCEENEDYNCHVVKKGETWSSLFPDEEDKDIVMRINRVNTSLRKGQTIAIPDSELLSHMHHSPFPQQQEPSDFKMILVDISDLAFGAYNVDGTLQHWGPISTGKNYCADVKRGCKTPTGEYAVYRKQGASCKSSKFPLGKGGAPMPYCMFFKGGFALHGSPNVPGYNDSHGCVRLYTDDAKWLNQYFVDDDSEVKVIIRQ